MGIAVNMGVTGPLSKLPVIYFMIDTVGLPVGKDWTEMKPDVPGYGVVLYYSHFDIISAS